MDYFPPPYVDLDFVKSRRTSAAGQEAFQLYRLEKDALRPLENTAESIILAHEAQILNPGIVPRTVNRSVHVRYLKVDPRTPSPMQLNAE